MFIVALFKGNKRPCFMISHGAAHAGRWIRAVVCRHESMQQMVELDG